jgi:hypothetical protein
MSAKHTPGPWFLSESDHNDSDISTPDRPSVLAPDHNNSPWHICRMDSGVPNVEANARLIAASPDLLDALMSFPGFTDNARVGDDWIEKAHAAIAKATGKEAK